MIGARLMKADALGDGLCELREAAGHKRRMGAMRAHGAHKLSRAGRQRDARQQRLDLRRESRPRSSATRSLKAPSNAISPRIARSVIAATCSRKPTRSASSSIHSCPIMVESMSATSRLLRRPVVG